VITASKPKSGFMGVRIFLALALSLVGISIAMVGLRPPRPQITGKNEETRREELREERVNLSRRPTMPWEVQPVTPNAFPGPTSGITFGHPIISGIGGVGFEQDLRLDPTNAQRLYTSAPGTAAANTSWIWHSLDGGKTFKWVVGAAPLQGKVTTCNGGGDTELAVDSAGHLYFNDLTLANFSTARSDDFGATFTCSNTGVPDSVVDRQWYAVDGDPTNGGTIYLANDEIGPGGVMCGNSTGNNVLVMYRSPVSGVGATAGITFGPANHVSAVGSCDEAIMGNNELSPVATTLGQRTNPADATACPPIRAPPRRPATSARRGCRALRHRCWYTPRRKRTAGSGRPPICSGSGPTPSAGSRPTPSSEWIRPR
jgi:hypothetical protein